MTDAISSAETFAVSGLNAHYGDKQALFDVSVAFPLRKVSAIIGASGCGKSTLVRCLNRMNDVIPGFKMAGSIRIGDIDLLDRNVSVEEIRRRIGMVFQKPNPFPKSIERNITWGPSIHRQADRGQKLVESSLKSVGLWDEVKDDLNRSGLSLSGGQQQRLCIARAIAMSPEVILMDEPCSALDPRATKTIEDLITQLSKDYTIIIVTHNMQQAQRISDYTAFMHLGKLIEWGETKQIFEKPVEKLTEDYVKGKFG